MFEFSNQNSFDTKLPFLISWKHYSVLSLWFNIRYQSDVQKKTVKVKCCFICPCWKKIDVDSSYWKRNWYV